MLIEHWKEEGDTYSSITIISKRHRNAISRRKQLVRRVNIVTDTFEFHLQRLDRTCMSLLGAVRSLCMCIVTRVTWLVTEIGYDQKVNEIIVVRWSVSKVMSIRAETQPERERQGQQCQFVFTSLVREVENWIRDAYNRSGQRCMQKF